MRLFRFWWHEGEGGKDWQCAAKDLRAACGKFCGMHPEVEEFRVTCGGEVAVVG